MAGDLKEEIFTDGTPETGITKKLQILLRRKNGNAWEQSAMAIPEGEPCFSYDSENNDYILKIGAKDADGNLQTWNALQLLRGRVDDGELI